MQRNIDSNCVEIWVSQYRVYGSRGVIPESPDRVAESRDHSKAIAQESRDISQNDTTEMRARSD